MTREEYFTMSEAIKNLPLEKENWYITFPPPDKLKNFDSLNCRMVFFVVTDVPLSKSDGYMDSISKATFQFVRDMAHLEKVLHSNKQVTDMISFLDFSVSNSLNRVTKEKVISFTIHYVDKVGEALRLLNK